MSDQIRQLNERKREVLLRLEQADANPGMFTEAVTEQWRSEWSAIEGELSGLYAAGQAANQRQAEQLTGHRFSRAATEDEAKAIQVAQGRLDGAVEALESALRSHAAEVRAAAAELDRVRAESGSPVRYAAITAVQNDLERFTRDVLQGRS